MYYGCMDGSQIAQRRAVIGLTRQQLADAIGVDQATVWRWEAGESKPSRLAERAIEETLTRLEQNEGRTVPCEAATGAGTDRVTDRADHRA